MIRQTNYPCPCCGFLTLREKPPGTFAICPVCYWEDDDVQFRDPTYVGGANSVNLEQARKNFAKYSAITESLRENVRPPQEDEIPSE